MVLPSYCSSLLVAFADLFGVCFALFALIVVIIIVNTRPDTYLYERLQTQATQGSALFLRSFSLVRESQDTFL